MAYATETESPFGVFTIGNFPDKYIAPSGDITNAKDTENNTRKHTDNCG